MRSGRISCLLHAELNGRHHTPQAILLGLEGGFSLRIPAVGSLKKGRPGSDPERIDAGTIPTRYQAMLDTKSITLGGHHTIHYDHNRDMIWRYDQVLPSHPNGMRFSVFDETGDLLATNEYFRCVTAEVAVRGF